MSSANLLLKFVRFLDFKAAKHIARLSISSRGQQRGTALVPLPLVLQVEKKRVQRLKILHVAFLVIVYLDHLLYFVFNSKHSNGTIILKMAFQRKRLIFKCVRNNKIYDFWWEEDNSGNWHFVMETFLLFPSKTWQRYICPTFLFLITINYIFLLNSMLFCARNITEAFCLKLTLKG